MGGYIDCVISSSLDCGCPAHTVNEKYDCCQTRYATKQQTTRCDGSVWHRIYNIEKLTPILARHAGRTSQSPTCRLPSSSMLWRKFERHGDTARCRTVLLVHQKVDTLESLVRMRVVVRHPAKTNRKIACERLLAERYPGQVSIREQSPIVPWSIEIRHVLLGDNRDDLYCTIVVVKDVLANFLSARCLQRKEPCSVEDV